MRVTIKQEQTEITEADKNPLRFLRYLLLTVVLVCCPFRALSCPICLGIALPEPTLADEIMAAGELVLARAGDEAGALSLQEVIKGGNTLPTSEMGADGIKAGDVAILTRRNETTNWKSQGKATAEATEFVRLMAALSPLAQPDDSAWTARLQLFRPFLAHADDRLARSAWRVWASAPYRLFQTQVAQIPRAQLREWIATRSLAGQRNLWIVLLGINGNAEDALWLEESTRAAWKVGDETDVAALLTALVAQRGAAAVSFIEQHYIRDRDRTLAEVQAALAALGVHGREGTAEMRTRVVAAYRVFVAERKPLAGFVARDLTDWQQWDFAPSFEAVLKSNEPIYPSTRMALIEFLRARPMVTP